MHTLAYSFVHTPTGTFDDDNEGPDDDRTIMMPTLDSTMNSHGLRGLVFVIISVALNVGCILSCVCHMMGNPGGGTHRVPPSWAPTMEPGYTFTQWQREVLLWTLANSDLEPHRQAAMILQQLKGGARDQTRDLPVNIIMNGAVLNGINVDPVTYIMNILAERYGQLR